MYVHCCVYNIYLLCKLRTRQWKTIAGKSVNLTFIHVSLSETGPKLIYMELMPKIQTNLGNKFAKEFVNFLLCMKDPGK